METSTQPSNVTHLLTSAEAELLRKEVSAIVIKAVEDYLERKSTQGVMPLRVNIDQLAKMLGKSPRTIAEWKRRRKIPFEQIDSNVMFDISDVDAALKKFRRNAAGY